MKTSLPFLIICVLILNCKAGETVDVPDFDGYKNVKFLKIEGNRVRFSHADGIKLANLDSVPEDLRAKILKILPRVDVEAQAKILQAQQEKEERETVLGEFKKKFGLTLYGEILQVTKGGLLVIRANLVTNEKKPKIQKKTVYKEIFGSGNMGRTPQYLATEVDEIKLVKQTEFLDRDEVIFVKCDNSGLFEKKLIQLEVYPAGTFSYPSVGAGEKTVRAFTANLEDAMGKQDSNDPFRTTK